MPKPTFHALPDDKRTRLVDAAREEFGQRGYDQASIRRLVDRLGIAKGSIYQYFDDKFDLFSYLLEEAGRRKLEAVGAAEVPADVDVFDHLRRMYVDGLAFWRAEPGWATLGLRLLEPSTEPRLVLLRDQMAAASHEYLRGLLTQAKLKGQIDPQVDVDVVTHLVTAMLSHGLHDALMHRLGGSASQHPDAAIALGDDDLNAIAHTAVRLIERGIGA